MADKKEPVLTPEQVLYAFVRVRGRFPTSFAEILHYTKSFHTLKDLNDFLRHNPVQAADTLSGDIIGHLAPTVGANGWMLHVPELAKILIQGSVEKWDATKYQGHIGATTWWKTTNDQQKHWLTLSPAEQQSEVKQTTAQMSLEWRKMFGTDLPKDITKQALDMASGVLSADEWKLSLEQRPEFKAMYPGLVARRDAGLPDMTPDQYRQTVADYKNVFRQMGIDPALYNKPDAFTNLFVNDIRPEEEQKRLNLFRDVTTLYSPHMKAAFEAHAGLQVSDTDLYGLLSGTRPDLAQAYAAKTGTAPLQPTGGPFTAPANPPARAVAPPTGSQTPATAPEAPAKAPSLYDLQQASDKAASEEKAFYQSGGGFQAPKEPTEEERKAQTF